jgi:hypothetical protein
MDTFNDPFWPALTIRWEALWKALKDGWPAWLAIGGLLVAFGLGAALGKTSQTSILYAGTLLQFFGLVLVAKGLSDVRREFDRPSFFARLRSWLTQVATAFRAPQTISLTASAAIAFAGAGSATLGRARNANATVEERVAVLEADLEALRTEHTKHVARFSSEVSRLGTDLKSELQARTSADTALRSKIEAFAVGGLHLEAVGLIWLSVGILASSVPQRIAVLLELL